MWDRNAFQHFERKSKFIFHALPEGKISEQKFEQAWYKWLTDNRKSMEDVYVAERACSMMSWCALLSILIIRVETSSTVGSQLSPRSTSLCSSAPMLCKMKEPTWIHCGEQKAFVLHLRSYSSEPAEVSPLKMAKGCKICGESE